jgi:hypothetical protein
MGVHYIGGLRTGTGKVSGPTGNGLVQVNVPVAYLYVKPTVWISANPGFEVDRSALAPVIGEWNQCAPVAFQTLRNGAGIHRRHLPTH